jgi:hypothetical protein
MEAFQAITTKHADLLAYGNRDDRVWYETLEKVDRFLSDNGKRPGQTAKDPEEKRLGQWLAFNLTALR